MKRIVLFVVLGFVVAGCGSAHRAASNVTTLPRSVVDVSNTPNRLIVRGTVTIPHVKLGTQIACRGGDLRWMTVPAVPAAVDSKSYEVDESDSGHWLKRFSNGSLAVICGKK